MESRDYEIKDAIEKGREYYKSQSFDQHILDLYNEGIISKDKAKENATSAADMELRMSGLSDNISSTSSPSEEMEVIKIDKSSDDIFDLK